ncbi:hypothetical protein LCGC14_0589880 [marine sediment metagenome]|uniref:Uncharacterized protein n=1 Tax=marine sediment metagenome TaxID=412755 RepID=A0A0F9RXL1_9ZZZZ
MLALNTPILRGVSESSLFITYNNIANKEQGLLNLRTNEA